MVYESDQVLPPLLLAHLIGSDAVLGFYWIGFCNPIFVSKEQINVPREEKDNYILIVQFFSKRSPFFLSFFLIEPFKMGYCGPT